MLKNRIACFKINIIPIVKLGLTICGSLFSFLAILISFFSWSEIGINSVWIKILIFMSICLFSFILAAFLIVFIFKTKRIWTKGENKVSAFYGDIINLSFNLKSKQKRIIVIPVNDCFDTIVESSNEKNNNPLISANTIHGKWIENMNKKLNVSSKVINQRIQNNLKLNGYLPEKVYKKEEKNKGNLDSYALGTTAIIDGGNNVVFYLLVISKFDLNNKAQVTKRKLRDCIESLLDFYDKQGQGDTLYIPLVGTGRSRAGLTHKQSLDIIKSCILTSEKQINGSIEIVVYNSDKDKVSIFS